MIKKRDHINKRNFITRNAFIAVAIEFDHLKFSADIAQRFRNQQTVARAKKKRRERKTTIP